MDFSNFVDQISNLHGESIVHWKESSTVLCTQEGFLKLVEENHAFNYQLWHAEDKARREDKGFEFVYKAKREIDFFNQQRNDRMEQMDIWLFDYLQPSEAGVCPVHSETPGLIIDRLSILALKIYHMQFQSRRHDVDDMHRKNCLAKTNILKLQREQLAVCLKQLLQEVHQKTRTFKLYRQYKMYNDPALNPELAVS